MQTMFAKKGCFDNLNKSFTCNIFNFGQGNITIEDVYLLIK